MVLGDFDSKNSSARPIPREKIEEVVAHRGKSDDDHLRSVIKKELVLSIQNLIYLAQKLNI